MNASHASQERDDLRIAPVLGSDKFAPDDAVAVNCIALWPHIGVVEISGSLFRIADGDEIYMMADQESAIRLFVLINADRDHYNLRIFALELHQGGHLGYTGAAPRCPEVQKHDFAPIIGQMHGVGAVANVEIRGGNIELQRKSAAVAARNTQDQDEKEKNEV